jgi:hypothetical protein
MDSFSTSDVQLETGGLLQMKAPVKHFKFLPVRKINSPSEVKPFKDKNVFESSHRMIIQNYVELSQCSPRRSIALASLNNGHQ